MDECYTCQAPTELLFYYESAVKGEVKIYPEYVFPRSISKCNKCGHCHEILSDAPGEVYENTYSHTTYGDLSDLHSKYLKIRRLPKHLSDNYHRVSNVQRFADQHFGISKGKLLDVGCGLSVFPMAMHEKGWNVNVIDLGFNFVKHAEMLGLNAWQGNLENYEKQFFDLITFNKVLEHVQHPKTLLETAKEFLDMNGIVYLEVPSTSAQVYGLEREEFLSGHIHIFSLQSLEIVIRDSGYRLIEIEELVEKSGKFTIRAFCSPQDSSP
jgi:hypothetical protein